MPMTTEEKRIAIENKQKHLDSLEYEPTIPFLCCCVCWERLTEHNIVEKDGKLWDYCVDCNAKEIEQGKHK